MKRPKGESKKAAGAAFIVILCALSPIHTQSLQAQENASLIAHWAFDKCAGVRGADSNSPAGLVVRDSSGNGLDGKIQNTEQVARVEGKVGKALEFSGTERYKFGCVLVPGMRQIDLSKGFSVEAWIRFNDRHVRQDVCYIASDGAWKGPGWRFIVAYDGLSLQSGDGEEMWGAGAVGTLFGGFEKNRWYHLAGTYDGSVYRLYLDGIEVAASKPGLTLIKGTDTLSIGSYSGGTGSVFNGRIDELKLWRGARSPYDIVKDARLSY